MDNAKELVAELATTFVDNAKELVDEFCTNELVAEFCTNELVDEFDGTFVDNAKELVAEFKTYPDKSWSPVFVPDKFEPTIVPLALILPEDVIWDVACIVPVPTWLVVIWFDVIVALELISL